MLAPGRFSSPPGAAPRIDLGVASFDGDPVFLDFARHSGCGKTDLQAAGFLLADVRAER